MFMLLAADPSFRRSADGLINVNNYLLSLARPLILSDGGQDGGCLLAAHYRDPGIWPHVQESGAAG